MTDVQQRAAAKEFVKYWSGRGDEKQETQRFWIDLLRNVCGVADPEKAIQFELPVKLDHVSFIDGYLPETRVLIEQKSTDVDLRICGKPISRMTRLSGLRMANGGISNRSPLA